MDFWDFLGFFEFFDFDLRNSNLLGFYGLFLGFLRSLGILRDFWDHFRISLGFWGIFADFWDFWDFDWIFGIFGISMGFLGFLELLLDFLKFEIFFGFLKNVNGIFSSDFPLDWTYTYSN